MSNEYIERPDLNVESVINTNEQVHQVVRGFFDNYRGYGDVFNTADSYYTKYKGISEGS